MSRPTVRVGLRALSAMGVVRSRHGSAACIPSGPPQLGSEPSGFLAALHGFTREEMHEHLEKSSAYQAEEDGGATA